MGQFNPGLCLESLGPLSPQEGRVEGLRNGQKGRHLTQRVLWPRTQACEGSPEDI